MCSALSIFCQIFLLAIAADIASSRIAGLFNNKFILEAESEKAPSLAPISHYTNPLRAAKVLQNEDIVPFYTKENFPYVDKPKQLDAQNIDEERVPEYEIPTHLFTSPEEAYREAQESVGFVSPKEKPRVQTVFAFNGPLFREDFGSQEPLAEPTHVDLVPPFAIHRELPGQDRTRDILESSQGFVDEDPLDQSSSHLYPMIALASLGAFEGELGSLGIPSKEERYLKSFRPFK